VQVSGWVTDIDGSKYYMDPDTGLMWQNQFLTEGKKTYYFGADGAMYHKGLTTISGSKYYFFSNGVMKKGWLTYSNGKKRYFDPETGVIVRGWLTLSGKKYYLDAKSGIMYQSSFVEYNGKTYYLGEDGVQYRSGLTKISGKSYYFASNGAMKVSSWLTCSNGKKRYFGSDGVMVTGVVEIDDKKYEFDTNGYLIGEVTGPQITTATSERTLKNYLIGALQPVGKALYVWGGGWNDSTRKGISQTWVSWYNSQSSSYNYKDNNLNDLSSANRAKGLDCSGFVGWAAYQVMQKTSGIGYGYTVVSGEVGSYYKSLGWGSILTQANLASSNYTLRAGDVGYNDGHTWIVLGQCADKSIVVVHSTPNAGCQISGTPTPSGDYSSQAVALAKKYMSQYSGYTKYSYNTSCGNYIRNGNYLRWNSSTLSDPDGYSKMTADQILADLFE
jgi:glucan-binding YG repeat protein